MSKKKSVGGRTWKDWLRAKAMDDKTNKNQGNFAPLTSAKEFVADGYCIRHNFLTGQECEFFLSLVEEYRRMRDVPQIRRESRTHSLNYSVIDGLKN